MVEATTTMFDPTFRVLNKRRVPPPGTENHHHEEQKQTAERNRKVVVSSRINLMEGCGGYNQTPLPSEVRARVIMDNLRLFLANPPGEEITSLSLSGIGSLLRTNFPPEGKELLVGFVSFWFPKLTELEVDYFDNFLSPDASFVTQLLSAPLLQRLSCRLIGNETTSSSEPVDKNVLQVLFPQRFFSLPHVSVGSLELEGELFIQFFKRLGAFPKFLSFELIWTPLRKDFHFKGILEFVKLTKQYDYLDMKVSLDGVMTTAGHKHFLELAKAVVDSSATIRVIGFSKWMYFAAKKGLGDEAAREFFKRVEQGTFIHPPMTPGSQLPEPTEFLNMKRLSLCNKDDARNDLMFPDGLQRLQLATGFPMHLVSSLNHLAIDNYAATFSELMMSLMTLHGVSQLTSLKLRWTFKDDKAASAGTSAFCLKQAENRNPFRNLKSLLFFVDLNVGERGPKVPRRNVNERNEAVVKILLNGFKIPDLTLTSFSLDAWGCPPGDKKMVTRDALSRMLKGNLAKTVEFLCIDQFVVEEDALPLLETLKAKAIENTKKTINEKKRLAAAEGGRGSGSVNQ